MLVIASVFATGWLLLLGGSTTVTELVVDSAEYLSRFPQQQGATWLVGFAVMSLFLQLLIVPSGSLLLIGAGFIFGVLPSVAVYTLMQCIATWPVYRLCHYSLQRNRWSMQDRVNSWLEKSGVTRVTGSEPVISGMALRLTPVLPSAAASSIAALSGIPLGMFILATVLAGWVRPLFFASIGGAAGELSGFAAALTGEFRVAPLVLVFLAILLLLAVRLWLKHRAGLKPVS